LNLLSSAKACNRREMNAKIVTAVKEVKEVIEVEEEALEEEEKAATTEVNEVNEVKEGTSEEAEVVVEAIVKVVINLAQLPRSSFPSVERTEVIKFNDLYIRFEL